MIVILFASSLVFLQLLSLEDDLYIQNNMVLSSCKTVFTKVYNLLQIVMFGWVSRWIQSSFVIRHISAAGFVPSDTSNHSRLDSYPVTGKQHLPENERKARKVYLFTIDVAERIPVTLDDIRSWSVPK